jgi:hypothetical protein
LWGFSFNESTALTADSSMYQALEPVEDQTKSAVLASDVAYFDERGKMSPLVSCGLHR